MKDYSGVSPRQSRANFVLGVINGMSFGLFTSLTDASLVLPWFVGQLTGSPFVVGILLTIDRGGWFLPQLASSRLVERLPRKMPLYRATALLRAGSWLLLTAGIFVVGSSNAPLLLALFLVLYATFSIASGIAGLPFMDIVAKTIPASRRGSFFAWSDFTGGLLALVGSALAGFILGPQLGLAFPANFGWLFVLAALAAGVGLVSFTMVKEPIETVPDGLVCGVGWSCIRGILRRDRNFARFMAARVMLLLSTVAMPFYSVFAKDMLKAPTYMAGVYSGAFTAALVCSSLLWGWLRDHRGSRVVMLWTALLCFAAPLVPLLADTQISYPAFAVVFLLLGALQSGANIVSMSFVLDLAPAVDRVLYIGLANTVLGIVSFALIGGGWVAQRWGLRALFAVGAFCALASAFLTRFVHDSTDGPGRAIQARHLEH